MAPKTCSISETVQNDLRDTIDCAVTSKNGFETEDDVRSLAVDTIRDLRHSWSANSRLANGATPAKHDTVDKLQFVYTAAQRLHRYRHQPGVLPPRIISCFTKHISNTRELTVGVIAEILEGALAIERALEARVELAESLGKSIVAPRTGVIGRVEGMSAEPTGVTPPRSSKKRKGVFSEGDERDDTAMTAGATTSKLQKKSKKEEEQPVVNAEDAPATGEVAAHNEPKEGTETATSASAALTKTTDAIQATASSANVTQKLGPGNRSHEHSTKWYPDEEQFMRDLMTANVKWTFQQYSDANIARFKGTYYEDPTGVQQPGMREGRTANAIRLRLGTFRSALKGGQGASAKGTSGGDALGGTGGGRAAGGTRITASESTSSTGRAERSALVIYASGKVIDGKDSSATGALTEKNSVGPFDGADTGEDENPLGDLEEMASGVEAGEL